IAQIKTTRETGGFNFIIIKIHRAYCAHSYGLKSNGIGVAKPNMTKSSSPVLVMPCASPGNETNISPAFMGFCSLSFVKNVPSPCSTIQTSSASLCVWQGNDCPGLRHQTAPAECRVTLHKVCFAASSHK